MPSRIGYAVATAIFCLSIIAYATVSYIYLPKLDIQIAGMSRLAVPGKARISLPEGGDYSIYYEWKGVGSSDPIASDVVPDLEIKLREEDAEKSSKIAPPEREGEESRFLELRGGISYSYEHRGYTGVSVHRVQITKPGTYQFTAAYRDGRGDTGARLAIGKGVDGLIRVTSFAGAFLYFGGISLSVALLAWTYFKRQASRPT